MDMPLPKPGDVIHTTGRVVRVVGYECSEGVVTDVGGHGFTVERVQLTGEGKPFTAPLSLGAEDSYDPDGTASHDTSSWHLASECRCTYSQEAP